MHNYWKNNNKINQESPNPVVCFLNQAPSPIIIPGVGSTKAASAQGKGMARRQEGAAEQNSKSWDCSQKDTQNCRPCAAVLLLHFEIKLKH